MSILTKIVTTIFGSKSEKDLKEINPLVNEVNSIFATLENLSDDELKEKFSNHRKEIKSIRNDTMVRCQSEKLSSKETDDLIYNDEQKYLNDKMCEIFAIIKDAARRLVGTKYKVMGQEVEWNMVHYDVQIIGGVVLHKGKIAEMKTGEGKTLVSTLSICLNALTGRGVHVITVNDYLAERDSQWMGLLYSFLGLSFGCITNRMSPVDRKEIYSRDITYGTNNEFGFDYLRDNMASHPNNQVQNGHVYAIVDEVDSVLIDEARTPLIISGSVDAPMNTHYQELKPSVFSLIQKQTSLINEFIAEAEKKLATDKNEAGKKLLLAQRGMPKNKRLLKVYQQQGIQQLVHNVESDFIRDKKMTELDEKLFFTVDERSNIIDLTEMGRSILSPSNPEDFVLPDIGELFHEIENDKKLSKKEILEKKEEAQIVHAERSDRIHAINQLLKAYTLFEKDVDYIVQDGKVQIVDEHTGRVLHGRRYSDGLHQALSSKENVVIEKETQTMATITIQNYFRMYEKLSGMTGTAITEAGEFMQIYKLDVIEIPTNVPIQRKDQNDLVYKTKREKYNAVINHIKKLFQKGQPILVGTTSVEESETLSRMLRREKVPHNVLNAKQHQSEAEIVARAGQKSAITIATNMAGRGTDIKLGEGILDLGGLYILGTSRHESRRIDLQLRGRSGRQGDAGESVFYLSLEDNLMRLFGSDRIAKVMDKMGIEEGEVITHGMVSKSIERAQKKVEERNFLIRKHLLEYDDVMNQQRTLVYDRRNYALHEDSINSEIQEIINDHIDLVLNDFCVRGDDSSSWDWDGLNAELVDVFSLDIKMQDIEVENKSDLKHAIVQAVNVLLVSRKEMVEEELFNNFQKFVVFTTIDKKWREHLHSMDQLREGIGLRAYGQKNPLIEYKSEGFKMFSIMMEDTNRETLKKIYRTRINVKEGVSNQSRNLKVRHDESTGMGFIAPPQQRQNSGAQIPAKRQPIKVENKVGRNQKVVITDGNEKKTIKYKKAEKLLQAGWSLEEVL
tara:strand:- start:3239 stop:6283 length:3045 start_codon:yes stop_codon:yes gene_type:complete